VSLRRLVDDGWTWAWRALNPQRVPTPGSTADVEVNVL
jgi:hypothetical protein